MVPTGAGPAPTILPAVTYSTAEARQTLLEAVVEAADRVALALAHLGEAYEHLDEPTADRLEAELFRPAQVAYGRLQSTHAEFAARHGLDAHAFQRPGPPAPAAPRDSIETAVESIAAADAELGELQDSMLPVEVGDPPLRAGLADVRVLLDPLPGRARELIRRLGR
jgi:hypothetical protein